MEFHIGEHLKYSIFGLSFNVDTLITMWLTMIIIISVAFFGTRKIALVPNKIQATFENIVNIFINLSKDMGKEHAVVLMCLFLFILFGNLIGQFPFKLIHLNGGELASPTNDLNVTAALSVFVVFYYIYSGVKSKGLKYFMHYFQPIPFMAPFNFLEDLIRPLTLALRLFANILAGEILIMVLGSLALIVLNPESVGRMFNNIINSTIAYDFGLLIGSFLPLPIMFFELFVAFIQALVFTLLTSAYIQLAVQKH